jgi:hypothetical protein
MQTSENNKKKEKLNRDGIRGIILWYFMIIISFLVLLFFSGKLNWLNAWIYLAISVLYQTANVLLSIKNNPGMLNEHGKLVKKGTKTYDKIFVVLTMPIILVSTVIMAWDAILFRWSSMPQNISLLSAYLFLFLALF